MSELSHLDHSGRPRMVDVSAKNVTERSATAGCRLQLDEIKARVPIWKREHFTDGTAEWLGACPGCQHHHK